MKIIHIINSLNKGGAEQVLKNLILNDNLNYHYIFTFIRFGDLEKELVSSTRQIKNINILSFFLNPIYFWELIREFKKIDPDIIQSWMYHSNFFTIFLKPFINTNIIWNIRHGNIFKSNSKLKTKIIVLVCAVFSHIIPKKIIYFLIFSKLNHEKILYNKNKGFLGQWNR